ncbi:MAG: D-Ala-D-Ala carboxypeptidase family metallohydrolase [Porticoccaceae bacterium]|nr:D-Ala-D-Ala carboxypeptidase family metallohydrolase [Porticoccaceae bacterium]
MKYELKYFDLSEFDCQETGENKMRPEFLQKLDHLREVCGFPFYITSGYRSHSHSLERSKPHGGGTHTQGIACDVAVSGGSQRMQIVRHAVALGFNGIGVGKGFCHVDDRDTYPVCWCY